MDFTDVIKMHIERDKIKYNISYNSNNTVYIVNSYDSTVYPVIKYFD